MSHAPSVARSLELYRRAGQLIPGSTQLISRRADQFANGVSPIYAQKAKGSRFTDIDGTEYIDWVNAVGAVIIGHAADVVDDAVKEQISRGSIFTLNSPLEIELAEELGRTIPSAQMVRYTKGGGEANSVAARIARGVTGRDRILICGYHGWHDWYQAANFGVDPASGQYPFAGIEPIGVPKNLADTVIPFVYGKLDAVEALLEKYKGEVAAIMMEPARSEVPPAGYLEGVKALAKKHGAILIFDEVSCGWRIAIGGMQEFFGVVPDMTVVAKAMSNGYPMGAVVGSREVMEPAARMFISSSYWSDNVGLAASLATIRELKRRDSKTFFHQYGEKLRAALNQAVAQSGLTGGCTGLSYSMTLSLQGQAGVEPRKLTTLFVQEMARRKIYTGGGFRATLAHTDQDISETAAAAAEVLALIKAGLDRGHLDQLLVVDLKKDPFRRQVA